MGDERPDHLAIGPAQVEALIAEQVPELAGAPVVAVPGAGTVHAIFRIGGGVAARFPLRPSDPADALARLAREADAAAELARACSFPAPTPLHVGRPGQGYPMPWAVQTWVPGTTASPSSHASSTTLARDVADLIGELRRWDTRGRGFDGRGRGGLLADHDGWMATCIERSEGLLDTEVLRALWSRFRALPREDPDTMGHGDLIPANVLVEDGRLAGVLDTGGFGPADPALDLVAAWHLFADGPREQLRRALACSDLQWERGAAWAFEQATGAHWYYLRSNPAMAEMGATTLERIAAAFA